MKRRKNAIYTGQSKRASTGTGVREIVDTFYETLNCRLLPEDEIAIIPPEQVNPTHDPQHQMLIVTDYCIRKILPEMTSLFHWGDEVTSGLRALAPVVDQETVRSARLAATDVHAAADAVPGAPAFVVTCRAAAAAAAEAAYHATDATWKAARDAAVAREAARCVYYALVACIEAEDEAAYNRIIDLTNEMLESL